jgi:hypothetical protein
MQPTHDAKYFILTGPGVSEIIPAFSPRNLPPGSRSRLAFFRNQPTEFRFEEGFL